MKARVHVTLKPGVLDPQGAAIGQALDTSGFTGIASVRQGKVFEIDMVDTDEATARTQLDDMCRKLLANTVIENYDITIEA